jgi:hypothetical protein
MASQALVQFNSEFANLDPHSGILTDIPQLDSSLASANTALLQALENSLSELRKASEQLKGVQEWSRDKDRDESARGLRTCRGTQCAWVFVPQSRFAKRRDETDSSIGNSLHLQGNKCDRGIGPTPLSAREKMSLMLGA